MALLGIDLGGTKLAVAVFSDDGVMLQRETAALEDRTGSEVGKLIKEHTFKYIEFYRIGSDRIRSAGISVPGISHAATGTVWAPNIPGWDNYPLLAEVKQVCGEIPVTMDSDRACYILGETWQGNARGCRDAIFLSVGTGIGAGILVNGEILRGSGDIAGCVGWMALQRPFDEEYRSCGCFEYFAAGEGLTRVAKLFLSERPEYTGELKIKDPGEIKTADVFRAYENGDSLATDVIRLGTEFWGMAVANLVSLFNPEKIIFGGGVFGPAAGLIPQIMKESEKWAQPVGFKQVNLDVTGLGGDAGVYGAGFLALKNFQENKPG
jgi:glucokinase